MSRSTQTLWGAVAGAALLFVAPGTAVSQEADRLESRPGWTKGPHNGTLGDQASTSSTPRRRAPS
jgi:hypothetical protein